MKRSVLLFTLRWIINAFGIWLAVQTFGTGYINTPESTTAFIFAGLIFSIANTLLRPIVILLSLPFIIVTLGLFMVVVNGIIVFITFKLLPDFDMTFWYAVLTGIILSLVNYILSGLLEVQYKNNQKGDH